MPKAGSASRRGHASTASQALPLALPKKIETAAADGKVGVVRRGSAGMGGLTRRATEVATAYARVSPTDTPRRSQVTCVAGVGSVRRPFNDFTKLTHCLWYVE